jgi:hypothetical protein
MRRVVLASSFMMAGALACAPASGGGGGVASAAAATKSCTEFYYMDGATLAARRDACVPANGGTWSSGPCARSGIDGACASSGYGNCALSWQPGNTTGCAINNGTVQWCCQSTIDGAKRTCQSQGGTFVPGAPPYPIHDPC